MRVNKSMTEPGINLNLYMEERFVGTMDLFFKAIENTSGLPFQLISGSRIGEGYYLNMGSGIFIRFYRADSSSTHRYEGIGPGLAIARACVELLSENIWFSSKSGKGNEFRFQV